VDKQSRNGVLGLAFIGIGAALITAGIGFVVPVCATWSRSKVREAYRKGKEGMISGFETASDALGDMANKAHQPLGEAAKAAKQTAAIAAGAIESAAHYIKERVQ
jgi:hypothetical protein